MKWRPAYSLSILKSQIDELWPKRSTKSDGMLGDPAHAQRPSDHNPDKNGVVKAFDITHDPKNGVDCSKLATWLIMDTRTSYVIWNRRIWTAGSWRPYTGDNPHTKHLHLSVKNVYKDDGREWRLSKGEVMPSRADIEDMIGLLDKKPTSAQYKHYASKGWEKLAKDVGNALRRKWKAAEKAGPESNDQQIKDGLWAKVKSAFNK